MKRTTICLMCLLFLNIFSCKNDETIEEPIATEEPVPEPVIPVNFEENFGNAITARFFGRVVDEENMPVQGASVIIGNTITTTDIFGVFSGNDTTAFEKFAYVTVTKEGYINGSRTVTPSDTEVNYIEITLLREDIVTTINSGEESLVSLPNGAEVTFDGDFIRESGSPYNGEVSVILKHLNPDDENMETMMPGMLFAQSASGEAVVLETYGMLAVELRSSSGEELQLAEGSSSQISMPISINTNNPPTIIPLWYFDEEEGYWKEEGQATLIGNKYVGDVTHFSFWNYDYPYPAINLCITLVDEDGNLLPNTNLDIYSQLLNSTGTYGYTNNLGVECGLVPKGEQLIVNVTTLNCESGPHIIGPFISDADITLTASSLNNNTISITGTFVNCDGENVTNGYIQLFIDGNSEIIPVTNGTISYTMPYCGDSMEYSLKGVNITNAQVTEVISGTFNGSDTLNLNTLSSCANFSDSDGDGIVDTFEDINGDNDLTNDDTDEDGIPNYLDADDDGDGTNTADENYDGDNDPTNDDTDGDGIPDYLDAVDVTIFDSEIISTGCDPIIFNIDEIASQYDNPNMTYAFYETEADANAETNVLTSTYEVPFLDFTEGDNIYVKVTNTISNASAIASVYLFFVYTTDSDNDGLTDCEEITGVDNPDTIVVATGTSDPNDMNDPIDFTDTDGDGLTDLEETTGIDNPLTDIAPNGTSDPNNSCDPIGLDLTDTDEDGLTDCEETTGIDDPNTQLSPPDDADGPTSDPNDSCDPIEISPLVDSDNDGLTDCEETTGNDNPNTVSVATGVSNPNDINDPVDFTDTDGDGLTDIEETTGVDNPVTPATPSGTSDPNDSCDPIVYSPLIDSDNDGLTDCEETTGNDNPNTVFIPPSISNPNDANDPYPQSAPVVSVTYSPTVNEDVGTTSVQISLSSPSTSPKYFEIYHTYQFADPYASYELDYFIYAGSITIPPGQTQAVIADVIIVNDTWAESNEPIEMQLFEKIPNIDGGLTSIFIQDTSITIIDDDSLDDLPMGAGTICYNGEFSLFDLSDMDAYFLNGNSGTVTYHSTVLDAVNNINPIGPLYQSHIEVSVRIAYADGSVEISQIWFTVAFPPTYSGNGTISSCDSLSGSSNDGVSTFDLTNVETDITINNMSNLQIMYYESQADADNETNPIATPTSYTNTVSGTQTIYARATNIENGCTNVFSFTISVDAGC
ncbi:hypothetical protein C8N46_105280 [Kordia periserrulae]|uniref:Carboxypeptidase family protein n=1 Tax=Kordia periserrulae TaxID=701523 RepID=A0A2T6BYH3_9FLAO|nr:hypothetical protein [Kordia periserrulae]PTX61123.1 hypothetical protein C8N46_105280 [Kordia periserrulae]